ncbi:MAG: GntR family transcriptional regulator [Phycisphaerales bacterium]|nr:winged helix-turn-helix transcriptional regulator [Phycisphaerae bacterium]NNF42131.1 GntR family transcriptional regulator [Phycisphaerales bacterium]NNM25208.1 GntR family transcriptional regulator [Phycisphaerales bacterium]
MPESLDRFIALFHRRWAVPVLVALAEGQGAKFVTLASRLGVGRPTLRATLDDLVALGLVERNPGYGHPMRPEYLLTAEGARLAPSSGRLLATVRRLDIEPLAFRKWSMPLTYVLGAEPRRFRELREELPQITPRALTLSLKDLGEAALVRRAVHDEFPPITSYRLERRARSLLAALTPLAAAV